MPGGRRLEVFIHGGMHKTGTTSFQTFMDARRDELLAAGVFYPPGANAQHGLLLYSPRPDWNPAGVPRGGKARSPGMSASWCSRRRH